MTATVVVGAQWGDEGKGKFVDVLAERADWVVRFQGGNNAGHTLVIDGQKTILHHLPSGVLWDGTRCVLASGVVVDPSICLGEIETLRERGRLQDPQGLVIARECSVITEYHRQIDRAREAARGDGKIGTTGRGIGPCYEDRVGRRAVLVGDLLEPRVLREKVDANLREKNAILSALGQPGLDAAKICEELEELGVRLEPYIGDGNRMVRDAVRRGEDVVFEGAQGALLDVGLGTYPFVTSSHTISASLCVSAGVPPQAIDSVIGIAKAYCTRVGAGPFPTELHDDLGEQLRSVGGEFGSTTGRPRRCGWLDAVALRHAARINGLTSIVLTKLDVLSGVDTLRVATSYRDPVTGTEWDEVPADWRILERVEPVYVELPGWSENIENARTFANLPAAAREYVVAIEEWAEVPIECVSVGAERRATIERS